MHRSHKGTTLKYSSGVMLRVKTVRGMSTIKPHFREIIKTFVGSKLTRISFLFILTNKLNGIRL